jgi:hypothetical protein
MPEAEKRERALTPIRPIPKVGGQKLQEQFKVEHRRRPEPEKTYGSQHADAVRVALYPLSLDIGKDEPAIIRAVTLEALRKVAELGGWPWESRTLPALAASGVLWAIKSAMEKAGVVERWPYSALATSEGRKEARAVVRLLERGRGAEVRPFDD